MYLQEQLSALKKQQIQVGFAATFQDLPAAFDGEVLQRVPFVAVFSSQHRFARQASVALSSLIEEPFFFVHINLIVGSSMIGSLSSVA